MRLIGNRGNDDSARAAGACAGGRHVLLLRTACGCASIVYGLRGALRHRQTRSGRGPAQRQHAEHLLEQRRPFEAGAPNVLICISDRRDQVPLVARQIRRVSVRLSKGSSRCRRPPQTRGHAIVPPAGRCRHNGCRLGWHCACKLRLPAFPAPPLTPPLAPSPGAHLWLPCLTVCLWSAIGC